MKACRILRIQSASTYLPLRQPTPILTPQLSRISSHLSTIHKPRYFSAGRLSHFSRRPTALRKQDHQNPFRATRRNFATKTRADPSTKTASQQLTISQRFRKLSREYGWSAMGVYLGLSALDFPFCFAAVQWLGVERIGHAEQIIVGSIKQIIPDPVKDTWRRVKARKNGLTGQNEQESHVIEIKSEDALAQVIDEYDHGVRMAEEENKSENASEQILDEASRLIASKAGIVQVLISIQT